MEWKFKSEQQVRKSVEKDLRRRLDDYVWQKLVEKSYVKQVLFLPPSSSDFSASYEILKETAKNLQDAFDAGRQQGVDPVVTEDNKNPLSDLLPHQVAPYIWGTRYAKEAANDPLVRRFREEYLSDGLLSWSEVDSWIKEYENREKDLPSDLATIVLPPGHVINEKGQIEPPLSQEECESLTVRGDKAMLLEYSIPGKNHVQISLVGAGGVLDRLRHISHSLAARYGWQEAQATVFVLTGAVPLVPPIKAWVNRKYVQWGGPPRSGARIHLDVDVTVGGEAVRAAYIEARRQVLDKRHMKPSTTRVATLVYFVESRPGMSWKDRWEEWNREYPAWSYKSEVSMRQVYHREKEKLEEISHAI